LGRSLHRKFNSRGSPDFARELHGFASIVPAIAEIWMLLYLLVIGVRTARPEARALTAAPAI